jgi:pimeloyl-ACP methyl ester carboxylesterase
MPATKDWTIELDGLPFHYRETGDPSAPPLVALHALGLDARDWDGVAAALAGDYRVLALDQRGHGTSARPDAYSFELMRDDLARFADALGLDRFTLLGHSMGGTVAFLFAEAQPARIGRLVVVDTPPPVGGNMPEPPAEAPQPVPFDWRLLAPIVRQLNRPDSAWWAKLPDITAPTLLIGGGTTSHVPQEKLAEVAALIPDCRLITIEGAGHNVHTTRPKEFLAAVRPFLKQSDAC